MSEQTKHDNWAVWGDARVADGCFAEHRGFTFCAIGQRGAGRLVWYHETGESVARGLCSALADALGVELHAKGTADKLQELATEPIPGDDCWVQVLLQHACEAQDEADNGTVDRTADEYIARAHNLREAARYVRELEAQVAAFKAQAEAAGYEVSADGTCWTGRGGGQEFLQGPPIDITHGEDPGDYLERIREGTETVDHLQAARKSIVDIEGLRNAGYDEKGASLEAIAHATIAQAERMTERNALLQENVRLLTEGLAIHRRGQELAEQLAVEEQPPHIRYGAEVSATIGGRQWICQRGTVRAWGDTPTAACAAFDRLWETGTTEEGGDQ